MSEKEKDLPVAMDCTALALVDAVQSNPASLLAENQDCGVEVAFPHEGTCSAAPVAQNEFSSSSAIAEQTQEQVEQGYSATLLVENSVSGVEIKPVHEGTCSAAPVAQNEFSSSQVEEQVELNQPASLSRENQATGEQVKDFHEGESSDAPLPNPEKWSHEAIVARSNLRPERMEKLKLAANSGQNPGFDFLQECWEDDPALQIVIKKLLAKFPQWGVAIVDGALVG
ncbi:hypothetical protein [Nostoc punctiforme]|nr:hypothetical protein [Nostoc punctiforme]